MMHYNKVASLAALILAMVFSPAIAQVGAEGSGGKQSKSGAPNVQSQVWLRAKHVAAGTFQTCVITTTTEVKCWGKGESGELGNGTTENSSTPVIAKGLKGATQLALGDYHSCALLSNGSVMCWGQNYHGQSGGKNKDDILNPALVSGISSAIQVVAGSHHTCAVIRGGTVKCWGQNYFGQLGVPATEEDLFAIVDVATVPNVTQLSAKGAATCALGENGVNQCWGYNGVKQLASGLSQVDNNQPGRYHGLASATQIETSGLHTCALYPNDILSCWGLNAWGQLGTGKTDRQNVPHFIRHIGTVSVALGAYTTCILDKNGIVQCWGANDLGQLGRGTVELEAVPNEKDRSKVSMPAEVQGLKKVVQLAVGSSHACVIDVEQAVYCWGANRFGQVAGGREFGVMKAHGTPAPVFQ
jgi:alpha-tubulin suppressor-like RCC1 family protein